MDFETCDILIIEDNPADAELMLRAFRKAKLANPISVVEDGPEALDYLLGRGAWATRPKHPTPRVVVLDLKLPKMSGLEVLRVIRADEKLKKIPVVVVTSSREAPDLEEAYRLGANSYVVKPVEIDKFVEAMAGIGLYWLLVNEPPLP